MTFGVDDKEFKIEFTDEDLAKTVSWSPEKQSPPLSFEKAVETGRNNLKKYIQKAADWELEALHYDRVGNDKWVCILEFRSPSNDAGDSNIFRVVVKMDGTVILPQVSPRKE
jgi:hypothetical protein